MDGVEQQVHCCVGAPGGGGRKGIGGLGAFGADLVGLGFSLGAGRVDGGAGVCVAPSVASETVSEAARRASPIALLASS